METRKTKEHNSDYKIISICQQQIDTLLEIIEEIATVIEKRGSVDVPTFATIAKEKMIKIDTLREKKEKIIFDEMRRKLNG